MNDVIVPLVTILFAGINAKYSHTNLAIRLLKKFLEVHCSAVKNRCVTPLIGEWNINMPHGTVLRALIEKRPDMVLFSVYIWNRDFIFRLAEDLRRILPQTVIVLGGPEVSWSVDAAFQDCPAADFIATGEGEETIRDLVDAFYLEKGKIDRPVFCSLAGLTYKDRQTGRLTHGPVRFPMTDLDQIPFPYRSGDLDFDPQTRIVYYESSRGCPFSCAYCLSSIEKSVRYYSLERVFSDLEYFLTAEFPLIKFVDRTFNLDPARYLAIWKFIRDRYNGKTLFHFEIAAEFLPEEAFSLLETMPEGSIQFEIGIQSINPETLKIVGRPAHPELLAKKIRRIPKSIHQHVDLIAGLPAENLESFARSFDYAFLLDADMLQLGFLKILSGSLMEKIARSDKGFIWSSFPPYEILSTPVLSFEDVQILKDVERVIDTWYNSALMRHTLRFLAERLPSPFLLIRSLVKHIRDYYPDGDLYLPRRPADSYACLSAFINGTALEYLRYDFLMQGKPGAFPSWFERRYSKTDHDEALERLGLVNTGDFDKGSGTSRRIAYSQTEYDRFYFSEGIETAILFRYPGNKEGEKKRVTCIHL